MFEPGDLVECVHARGLRMSDTLKPGKQYHVSRWEENKYVHMVEIEGGFLPERFIKVGPTKLDNSEYEEIMTAQELMEGKL